MTSLRRVFSNWWVLSSLTALVLIALVVLVLPLVVDISLTTKLLFVALVLLVWGALAGWRIFRARRASDRIEQKLGIAAQPVEREADVLARRMREALAALKQEGGAKGDYLYSRPWYVMIGPPGAGKTTALLNSGLRFPGLSGRPGIGGTRNIDFLFAEEAVLLDTAGRYTSQDSDAARDREAWVQFLNLLKTNRPLQPVNGVIVAIGLDELAGADLQTVERHASIVEARLRELGDALQIEVPVYALFTKADLIAGFAEFHADLDVEGRRAVLGATLPWNAEASATPATIAEHFDELMNAVDARTSKRLQEEMDLRRRSLIVGYPAQMSALRERLLHFLERAFTETRRRRPVPLRGFYFTSGVQQGTPFDRLLGRVATLFDAPLPAPGAAQGRAFFINRLLKDVIIGEAGLVRRTPAIRKKEKLVFVTGAAAIASICVLVIALWTVSFFNNLSWTSGLQAKADIARQHLQAAGIDLAEVHDADLDLGAAGQVLGELRALPGGYAQRHGACRCFWSGFGLYEDSVGEEAERAYVDTTQRVLLPRAMLRMEQRLRTGQSDRFDLYDTLKAYLLVGGRAPSFDPAFVERWIADDWAVNLFPGGDLDQERGQMQQHLHVTLNDSQFGRIWGDGGAPLDGDLVKSAQASVQTMSMAERAYAILKQKSAGAGPDWHVDEILNPGTAGVFAGSQALLTRSVPYLFTKNGYQRAYLIGLANVQRDLDNDAWMFESSKQERLSLSQRGLVHQGVEFNYARDYIAAWAGIIAVLEPADYFRDRDAFRAAVMPSSPIKEIMLRIKDNTDYSPGTLRKLGGVLMRRMMPGTSMQLDMLRGSGTPSSNDAAAQIQSAFQDFNRYVSEKGDPSLDDFLAKLRDAGNALTADNTTVTFDSGGTSQGTFSGAAGHLGAAAAMAPPQLRAFMSAAVNQSTSAGASQTVSKISTSYTQNIQPACTMATAHRYPFVQDAVDEADPSGLASVFGAGGLFDNFVKTDLHAFVEPSEPYWRWSAGNPVTADFGPETPSQLQKTQNLRDLLASGVQARIEAVSFGGTITAAELLFDGTPLRFERGQNSIHPILWTTALQPEAKVTLFAGTEKVQEIAGTPGRWAFFHLLDKAKEEAQGPYQFKATFGDGASFAVFRVTLIGAHDNPFNRAGLWSFRCPPRL